MLEPAQIITENRDKGWFDRLNGQFNLTMTYRLDSDVPIAYGKIRPFYADEEPQLYKDFGQSKNYLVRILEVEVITPLTSQRNTFLEEII